MTKCQYCCRDARGAYWHNEVVDFRDWRMLNAFTNRAKVREYEIQYAARYGCQVDPSHCYSLFTTYVVCLAGSTELTGIRWIVQ